MSAAWCINDLSRTVLAFSQSKQDKNWSPLCEPYIGKLLSNYGHDVGVFLTFSDSCSIPMFVKYLIVAIHMST